MAVIDFEASGLGDYTYPIEVALGIWRRQTDDLRIWSSLIRPTVEWVRDLDWHASSQNVHGIAPAALATGMHPMTVMTTMNDMMHGIPVAYCDGGRHDVSWMGTLSRAAGVPATFVLSSIGNSIVDADDEGKERYRTRMESTEPRHRAASDVSDIMTAIAGACLVDVPKVVII